jgi:hypothetical protein
VDDITVIKKIPTNELFYQKYVGSSTPLIIKSFTSKNKNFQFKKSGFVHQDKKVSTNILFSKHSEFYKKTPKKTMTVETFFKKNQQNPSEYFLYNQPLKKFTYFKNYPKSLMFDQNLIHLDTYLQIGSKFKYKLTQDPKGKFIP